MKQLYIFLLLVSASLSIEAQWYKATGGNQGPTLRGVACPSGSVTYIVGGIEAGTTTSTVVKTLDAGATWVAQTAGIDSGLRSVYCFDELNCIACGYAGRIIKTTDGGTTWVVKSSGTNQTLRTIDFTSPTEGFIGVGLGSILKTTDAGETWSSIATGIANDIIQVRFANPSVGFCVSSSAAFSDGAVLKTIDGGATWTSVYTNATQGLLGLAVIDENIIYAGGGNLTFGLGNAYIVKSTDGGTTWQQVYLGYPSRSLRGAAFTSADRGWFIGDQGYLIRTEDGGATWLNDSIWYQGNFGIDFANVDTGFASGGGGFIQRYVNECQLLGQLGEILGPSSACTGDTVSFSVPPLAGAINYDWSIPSGSFLVSGQGTKEITFIVGAASGDISVTALNSCDTSDLLLATLTVNPSPPVPTITFIDGVLSSSSATTYQWYLNGTSIFDATDSSYVPVQNGMYYVVITNDFGCSAMSDTINVLGVGNIDPVNESSLIIIPNPAHQWVTIYAEGQEAHQLLITDLQGRMLKEFSISAKQEILFNSGDLSEGLYFIHLLNKNGEVINREKLVVN